MHQDAVTTTHSSAKADLTANPDLAWSKDARATPEARADSFNQRSSAMQQKPSFTPSPLILGNPSDDNIAATGDPTKLSDARNRWRFTGPGQIVDGDGSHWDIAEEIMKMQIHDGRKASPGTNPVDPTTTVNQGVIRDNNTGSPLNTPSSDASSSSPDDASQRLVLHSRGASSDTSSEPSVVTPLHSKISNGSTAVALPTPSEEHMFGKNDRALISDSDVRQLFNKGPQQPQHHQQNADAQATSASQDDQYSQQPRYPSLAQSQPPINYGPMPPPPQHMQRGPHMPSMPLGYDYRFPLAPRQPPPHAQQQQPQQPQIPEELQVDYNLQPRLFGVPNGTGAAAGGTPQNPHGNNTSPINDLRASTGAAPFTPNLYRQQQGPPHRGPAYPPPPHMAMPGAAAMASQSAMPVPTPYYAGPAGQPMYDLVMPGRQLGPQAPPPGAAPPSFRPQHHHHSSSDSTSLREMALMAAAAQQQQQQQQPVQAQQSAQQPGQRNTPPMMGYSHSPSPGIYTPPSGPVMYPNPGFYPPSLAADIAQALARLPPGYANALSVPTYPGGLVDPQGVSGGPSANNRKLGLYKTELCRSWEEKGSCRYGPKCQFAHGEDEIRKVQRHPKYKTEICRTFWVSGSCPYGKRCCFIHTELPSNGAPNGNGPGEEQRPTNAAPNGDGRARSLSTGSDPSEGNTSSLLARISARRNENPVSAVAGDNASGSPTPPGNPTAPPAAPFGRPAIGSLKLDTSSLETSKNGYPYSSNPAMPAPGISIITEVAPQNRASQAPMTAGPDFGRHAAARLQVVGYNTNSSHQGNGPSSNGHQYGHGHFRHSLSGNEALLSSASSAQQQSSGQPSSFGTAPRSEQTPPPAQQPQSAAGHSMGHTHARSDSGNSHHWAEAIPRGHLTAHPSHAASEMNAPWLTARPEIAVNERRYNERNWV